MNRRKFLGLGLGAATVAMVPMNLSAIDFRATKPKLWKAKKIDTAMVELFGTSKTTQSGVKLKAPDIAENGAVVPVSISSKLAGRTVALFQNADPESTVAVFTVPTNGLINYKVRIKMAKTGTVTAVVDVDGKLYSASKIVKVTKGGCGGWSNTHCSQ